MKVMAGLCSYVTFIWESPFLFEFGYIDLSQQTDKLLFSALRKRCHCEERSDVAIPRLEGKCSEFLHEEWERPRFWR